MRDKTNALITKILSYTIPFIIGIACGYAWAYKALVH